MMPKTGIERCVRFASNALIICAFALASLAQSSMPNPARAWWRHIQYLASDELTGRETGSEGHRRAAEYIATNAFKRAGLKPGGTRGYFEPVKFISRKIVEEKSSLAIIRNPKGESIGKEEPIHE
jgi:hypothetical protein